MSGEAIDLNADLGEGGLYDVELLKIVSSCNIACGGHAGDAETMRRTLLWAMENDVSIGAHPSYPDREGFGRRSGYLSGEDLLEALTQQINDLNALAIDAGAELSHVKPHGALYNDAVNNRELADLIARAILAGVPSAVFVGLPDSELQEAPAGHVLKFITEGFIDRAYRDDGQLVPRTEPGAVHKSLELVLPQAVSLVGKVDTLCIHGDTPGAAEAAAAVRTQLEKQGVTIRAFRRR